MRIIAGTRRSLPLCSARGQETRPTTDRIKETLFNILQDRIYGCRFLDLFAGSGQIGLEALSRGASFACFIEHGAEPLRCIEENIRFTKFESESLVLPCEVERGLNRLRGKEGFDLIFLDPPYGTDLAEKTLALLAETKLLKEGGQVVAEAPIRQDFSFAEQIGFMVIREKEYKTNKHVFMKENDG